MSWNDEDYVTHSAASPDGALRLEGYCHPDERAAPSYSLRLSRTGGGEKVLHLGHARWAGQVEFDPGTPPVFLVLQPGTGRYPSQRLDE